MCIYIYIYICICRERERETIVTQWMYRIPVDKTCWLTSWAYGNTAHVTHLQCTMRKLNVHIYISNGHIRTGFVGRGTTHEPSSYVTIRYVDMNSNAQCVNWKNILARWTIYDDPVHVTDCLNGNDSWYIYMYWHTHTCTHIYKYMHIYIWICIYIYHRFPWWTWLVVYIYIYIHTRTYTHTNVCIFTCI